HGHREYQDALVLRSGASELAVYYRIDRHEPLSEADQCGSRIDDYREWPAAQMPYSRRAEPISEARGTERNGSRDSLGNEVSSFYKLRPGRIRSGSFKPANEVPHYIRAGGN